MVLNKLYDVYNKQQYVIFTMTTMMVILLLYSGYYDLNRQLFTLEMNYLILYDKLILKFKIL